jgi:hypothetical protein
MSLTCYESFKTSPYYISPNNDGSISILFNDDGKLVYEIMLDRDNAVQLAFHLLTPIGFNPSRKGVLGHLYQNEPLNLKEVHKSD